MSAYIPVAPDRWAEMVQASAEVGPLRNKVSDLSTQLEMRQVEIDRLRAEVDRLRKAGEWKSIKTIPAFEEALFILEGLNGIYFGFKCKKGWAINADTNKYKPLYWMPLPNASKEGRDAK